MGSAVKWKFSMMMLVRSTYTERFVLHFVAVMATAHALEFVCTHIGYFNPATSNVGTTNMPLEIRSQFPSTAVEAAAVVAVLLLLAHHHHPTAKCKLYSTYVHIYICGDVCTYKMHQP